MDLIILLIFAVCFTGLFELVNWCGKQIVSEE